MNKKQQIFNEILPLMDLIYSNKEFTGLSDGKILIVFPGICFKGKLRADIGEQGFLNVTNPEKYSNENSRLIPEFKDRGPCNVCGGSDKEIKCKKCNGLGINHCCECGSEIECRDCEGTGIIKREGQLCFACRGTGKAGWGHPVRIFPEKFLSSGYLSFLKKHFPAARLFQRIDNLPTIKFEDPETGCHGYVMGMGFEDSCTSEIEEPIWPETNL
ncbi:MAG: hypothetical protein AB1403_10900 [Candidatus Riflebacteria bacterium]